MDVTSRAELAWQRLSGRIDSWLVTEPLPRERQRLRERLRQHWVPLFQTLHGLYSHRWDFFFHLEAIVATIVQAWLDRSTPLRQLDEKRLDEPEWILSETIVGGALYVDRFAETLPQLEAHVGYFQELGLTYLHLMPPFAVREGDNDGGYAIADYRAIDPRLGTLEDLRRLIDRLHEAGIAVVLDLVLNHTSDQHPWALAAQAGDESFRNFYLIFPDRELPDRFERHLREIFPTVRRGNFSWHEGLSGWVWTTFNSFQWDLNYANPGVFRAMLEELLFLANLGVDVLRLDAVAFLWKREGTACESLPETHEIVRAMNRAAQIAAPALSFKAEAIVHPDEVIKYVSPDECRMAYNPTLMALSWESLATRKVALLVRSLERLHRLPHGTAWLNYVRCHDDIGWTFDDDDARALGIDPQSHRRFLNDFYTGRFPGSFARGVPFQANPRSGDMRISGTMASLAGLESALERGDSHEQELACARILLLHGVAMSLGGIPLLYLGEEWGLLNDYDFITDPIKAGDSRWIHRPRMRWEYLADLEETGRAADHRIHQRLYLAMKRLISLRRSLPALGGHEFQLFETQSEHVLGFVRRRGGHHLVVLASFSEQTLKLDGNLLRTHGLGRFFRDMVSGKLVETGGLMVLAPYRLAWLQRE